MFRRLRAAVAHYPKAVLFELADQGYRSPFQILVACIITIRTLEEVSLPTALKLFEKASTPRDVSKLTLDEIDELIQTCTFHRPKSRTIHAIASQVEKEFGGNLPCDYDALTSLSGVGPKCANLTLGIACNKPTGIPVDIHVHRVTNRWGLVSASTPEKTMASLEAVLPRRHWPRDQQTPGLLRQTRLHRQTPRVLHLSPSRVLPSSRDHHPPLNAYLLPDKRICSAISARFELT